MITYSEYTSETGETFVVRDNGNGSVSHIPCDSANADYQQYVRWLENPDAELDKLS